ncbi:MAG TPA: diguanylate cyclase, partial [Burkholderiales bacterium]|nr:diguanylate cyclase [Burkholderiales bacterium]
MRLASAALAMLGAVAALAVRAARRARAALQYEKELAQVALHSIADGVITTNAKGCIEYLNPVAEQYTGWTLAEARGQPLSEVYRITDERTGVSLDALNLQSPGASDDAQVAVSVSLAHRDGHQCPIRYSLAPIRKGAGRSHGMIVVFHDVSQIRAMAQQLQWQASHDALTGLVNRREFERRLNELIDSARGQNREHALMFLDLDNFRAVNDACGHAVGDEFLKELTAVMLSRMRGSDTLVRLGGDEFAIALETCPFDQAVRIANGMRETVREFRFVWQEKTLRVGVSIGLVPITSDSGNLNELLRQADGCCAEAKKVGRDRVQVCRPPNNEASRHSELQVVSQINQAFDLQHFRLYRQPIRPLLAGKQGVLNYEVLVRMVDISGNLI